MLLLTIPSFYWKVPFGQHWIMIYVILPCHRFEILYAFLPYCPFYLEELSFKLTIKPPFSFDGAALSASALLREWYCIFLPIMPFHSTNLFQAIPFLFSPVIGILSCLIFMSIMSELESIMTCPFSFSKSMQVHTRLRYVSMTVSLPITSSSLLLCFMETNEPLRCQYTFSPLHEPKVDVLFTFV